ncbi:MAG: calycin-like domain-containing protein [Bacteroidaceae bacterium]
MKKFLLMMLALCLMPVMGMAETKEYTDNLVVTINGQTSDSQQAKVNLVDNGDGTYGFVLKNFVLWMEGEPMPVGNIELSGMTLTDEGSYRTFVHTQNITIAAGDEGFQMEVGGELYTLTEEDWAGPLLGEIPVSLNGKANDEKMFVGIEIWFEPLQQNIHVEFGSDDFSNVVTETKTYTDNLVVTINGQTSDPQQAKVDLVDNGDGTYGFVLKNFVLWMEGEPMPVGNIELSGMTLTDEGSYRTFVHTQNITIAAGDEGFQMEVGGELYTLTEEDWAGPLLGEIPVSLNGKANDEKMFVGIEIWFEPLQQNIHVEFGSEDNFVVAPPTYTLTFMVEGDTIKTVELEEGAAIEYPEVEARKGYSFAWDKDMTVMPAEATTITGAYTPITYTLTFVVEGETVKTVELMEDDAIEYPEVEAREGYTFAWDKDLTAMPAEETTVTGVYTANIYKVIYMDGETVIASYEVAYGEALPEAPSYNRKDDLEYTYTFEGWQGDTFTTMPAHDVVYTAIIKSTPTSIDGILAADGKVKVYDLQGRRVERPAKGIYVINGKKVMVK